MPPKRKAPEPDAESATTPSGRSTRTSARLSSEKFEENREETSKTRSKKKTKSTKAAASRSKKIAEETEDGAPPAKKTKTTRSAATKNGKGKKSQSLDDGDDERVSSSSKVQPSNESVNPSPMTSKGDVYSAARSLELFQKYADDDDENVIGPENLEKLCNDAQISVESAMPMILAWQFDASEMMKFTKDEWVKGTASLKISSLPVLQTALSDLDELLVQDKSPKVASSAKKDPYDRSAYRSYASDKKSAFQKLYMFCFNLVKPEQSRNINMEMASALWTVLLVPKYSVMKEVLEFIQDKASYKAVNKDLWSMMLEFCETVKPDLSNYEADGAWPTLLDDFAASKKNGSESSE